MLRIAEEKGWTCFDEAKIAMLAPAGTNDNERVAFLAGRFGKSVKSEGKKTPKDFPDDNGEMLKAGTANFMANIPRTIREGLHLLRERVDYKYLASSGLGRIAIFSYAEDRLYPFRVQKTALRRAGKLGIPVATPISHKIMDDGKMRSGRYATHNDEQFNPERVAGALNQFFREPASPLSQS